MYRHYISQFQVIFLLVSISLLISGCSMFNSWLPDKADETKTWSASKLYAEAKASLSEGEYQSAIDLYEKLEARYPNGDYAKQEQK